jgi:hypothetical protein
VSDVQDEGPKTVLIEDGLQDLALHADAVLAFISDPTEVDEARATFDPVYGYDDFVADLQATVDAAQWAKTHPTVALVELNTHHSFFLFAHFVSRCAKALHDLGQQVHTEPPGTIH